MKRTTIVVFFASQLPAKLALTPPFIQLTATPIFTLASFAEYAVSAR